MRTKEEIISLLTNPGIIAIVRIRKTEQVLPITEALVAGGVNAVEITTTTPNAIEAIREISQKMGAKALIGVGTVLDGDTCRAAIDAGAQYIVSPICRVELVSLAHAANRPVMLGAYTPTEAQLAHEAGSDFIKIFPADTLGAKYVKALRAPLPHLRIVPTGGIDARNIGDFFKAGCAAVGIGSSLVSAELLQKGDWAELTRRAAELVKAARQSRPA
ncbi:MAG TPA: bifunctional 4-hydroxy-2-oxoglutarate aldolase/2-dehydro-3-deoxy-phosphogluconate aldolase [Verrucomicrobiae bacterium]|nr:bifunctional 4-hydroxy-2-oxoglutarate aldolase/2-dehydro-3-deoxy-phosphogluconate aldolase [Verrucomicrobiae bacterium]